MECISILLVLFMQAAEASDTNSAAKDDVVQKNIN